MVTSARGRSPQFLRRVHNRPAVRRRSSLVVFLQLLLVASGLAVGGLAAWGGYTWIHDNRIFRLEALELDGVPAHLLPAARRELEPLMGANLLLIDLDAIQRRLETVPQVLHARVRRTLPRTIEVALEPRPTWGVLRAPDGGYAVSSDGIVVGPAESAEGLPEIRIDAPVADQVGADGRLRATLLAAQWLDAAIAAHDWILENAPLAFGPVDHYRLEEDGVVLVIAREGWEIAIGDAADLAGKAANLDALLRQSPPTEPSRLDLRYRDMVVVRSLAANARQPEE